MQPVACRAAAKLTSPQLPAEPNDLPSKKVEIRFPAAMIGDRDAQTVPAEQGGVGRCGEPPLLQPDQDLIVQRVEVLVLQPSRVEAEGRRIP
jgi:hypothetical protein